MGEHRLQGWGEPKGDERGRATTGVPVAHSHRRLHVWFYCHYVKPHVWSTPAVKSPSWLLGTDRRLRPRHSPSWPAVTAAVMESPFPCRRGWKSLPRQVEGWAAWKCVGWSPGNAEPQSVSLPIYPSSHLAIYPSIHLSIYLSSHLFIYLSSHIPIYLCNFLVISMSICLLVPIYLPKYLFIYLYISIHVSMSLSLMCLSAYVPIPTHYMSLSVTVSSRAAASVYPSL